MQQIQVEFWVGPINRFYMCIYSCMKNSTEAAPLFTNLPWPGVSKNNFAIFESSYHPPPSVTTHDESLTLPLIAESQAGKL